MYQESLDVKQHIHLLGVSYVSNFLDRAGFTILEANTDQNHHFQLLAKINDKSFLIAIRTAHHGTGIKCSQFWMVGSTNSD